MMMNLIGKHSPDRMGGASASVLRNALAFLSGLIRLEPFEIGGRSGYRSLRKSSILRVPPALIGIVHGHLLSR